MSLKKQLLLLFIGMFLFVVNPGYAFVKPNPPMTEKEMKEAVKDAKEEWKSLSKKERRAKKKQMRKEIKEAIRENKTNGDTDLLLLVIISILLPPLGMFLYEGDITNRFWISLLLTLLFYIPGLIYTLVIILGDR